MTIQLGDKTKITLTLPTLIMVISVFVAASVAYATLNIITKNEILKNREAFHTHIADCAKKEEEQKAFKEKVDNAIITTKSDIRVIREWIDDQKKLQDNRMKQRGW